MNVPEKTNLIIYRVRDNGLEVFMVRPEQGQEWEIPSTVVEQIMEDAERVIQLDPVEYEGGILEQAYAIEGDWHDIPSLKAILKEDVKYMTNTLMQMVPDVMEKGTFFAVKEAFKKVLPHQYEMLKELKDILIDRNSTRNI
jgi:predicted NUDIX family NTP pyrophosphohydrolase